MKKLSIQIISLIFCVAFILLIMPFQFHSQNETKLSTEGKEKACPSISIELEEQSTSLPLEQYVARVVQAEMPSTFALEALKAQAIASRTYAVKTTDAGQSPIKPTTDHQVFSQDTQIDPIVQQAVRETEGDVLFYQDELATAMFFSTSNGWTESAKNFSGNEIPYLQTIISTSDIGSPKYEQSFDWTIDEWNKTFGFTWTSSDFENLQLIRNESHRVETVQLGKRTWTGREWRTLLNLPSTDFIVQHEGKQITVHTKGYGHGVGMSQYGANAMAQAGETAPNILSYYYPNTSIKKLDTLCLKPDRAD